MRGLQAYARLTELGVPIIPGADTAVSSYPIARIHLESRETLDLGLIQRRLR